MNESGMSYTRQVVLALTIAGTLVLSARGLEYVNETNGRGIGNPLPKLGGVESYLAWGVMLVFLIALAELPNTGALGASFAWLVLFAILYVYGIPAADNLRIMMSSKPITTASQVHYSSRDTSRDPVHKHGVAPR